MQLTAKTGTGSQYWIVPLAPFAGGRCGDEGADFEAALPAIAIDFRVAVRQQRLAIVCRPGREKLAIPFFVDLAAIDAAPERIALVATGVQQSSLRLAMRSRHLLTHS
ncbi:MAG TPA: hypothetical protein VKY24_14155 [Reyranella sp.]|nr:hypothetical protein [Reyranella sp.]